MKVPRAFLNRYSGPRFGVTGTRRELQCDGPHRPFSGRLGAAMSVVNSNAGRAIAAGGDTASHAVEEPGAGAMNTGGLAEGVVCTVLFGYRMPGAALRSRP